VRDVEASFNDKSAELSLPVEDYLVAVRSTNAQVGLCFLFFSFLFSVSLRNSHFQSPQSVATVTTAETVRGAIDMMTEKRIHRVWVVDAKGVPTGVFSASDVCRLFAHEPKELKELRI
jgi:CBS-domain-containing membrane protein